MLGRITRADAPDRTYDLADAAGRPVPVESLPVFRALHDGAVINLEVTIVRRDGATLQGQISAAPVHSPAGVRLGVVVVYQDISTRKELERVRRSEERRVGKECRSRW